MIKGSLLCSIRENFCSPKRQGIFKGNFRTAQARGSGDRSPQRGPGAEPWYGVWASLGDKVPHFGDKVSHFVQQTGPEAEAHCFYLVEQFYAY